MSDTSNYHVGQLLRDKKGILYPIVQVLENSVSVIIPNGQINIITKDELNDYELKDSFFGKISEEKQSKETINHPSHYNREGSMECIEEMELIFGRQAVRTFCILNAWKYRYRANAKNGEEDMKKADWYIKKLKELDMPF